MFRRADQIVNQLRAISRSSRWGSKLIARTSSAVAMVFAMLAGGTAHAHAQDLSKYGMSAISVIGGSSTANQGFTNGVPATSVGLGGIQSVRVDPAGNVYFIEGNVIRMIYVSGPVPSILQHAVADYSLLPDASSQPTSATGGQGNVYSLVNVEGSGSCADTTCGDGFSAATSVVLSPYGLAFDSVGNLYIADLGNVSVRKVTASTGTISTVAGDPLRLNSAYNNDNQPAIAAYLLPIGLAFDANDNLFVADLGNQLVRRVDAQTQTITTVAGNVNAIGSFCSDATSCGDTGAATSATLNNPYGVAVNTDGDIFISDNVLHVVRKVNHNNGNINVVAGQFNTPCADTVCGGEGHSALTGLLNAPQAINFDANGDLLIADSGDQAIRGFTTGGKLYTLAGVLTQTSQPDPPASFSGPANSAQFNFPTEAVTDAANHLIIADSNPYIWQVAAPSVLLPQTITPTTIPNPTYGAASFDLTSYFTVDSGLPLTFTCTGPVTCAGTNNATLTITGAGAVTVTANQAGDSTHGPATSQPSAFTVAKAVLTVRADPKSYTFMSHLPFPPLTYTLLGLVNLEPATVVTGTAVLNTTATINSPINVYPITVDVTHLTAANYTFTPMAGTFTISGGVPQTITFNPLPDLTYGAATFALQASASSGLPITYTVSGPAKPQVDRLTVMGVGTVTVTANQPGNEEFAAADGVTQMFHVTPALLSITAQPATRAYNAANPPFTYVATGFVSGDTSALLAGAGAPAFSTTAVMSSPPGVYPLTISQGTLFAANYTFMPVNSTLTIGLEAQTITFPAAANAVFGTTIPLTATAGSGLGVQYAVTGPATIVGNILVASKPGQVVVTATQPGSDLYQPATPVAVTYNFQKEPLIVRAGNFTIPFGGALPTFAYTFGDGSFTPPANEFSGVPDLETSATSTSAPGDYTIVAATGTLISDYYNFQYVNGTLTILQPSSFILTATPASITIPTGQARQVTVTLTPVNDFVGSVSIGCSGLPTGVTCVASPSTLTTTLNVGGVSPVTATLTIDAGAPVASARNKAEENHVTLAGLFWLPALLLGAVLVWSRKRMQRNHRLQQLLCVTLLLVGASGMIACGSSNKTNSVQPGTTTIQVTGSGTSTSGSASASLAFSVTIQ